MYRLQKQPLFIISYDPTRSVRQCLYLQRPCPLTVFSYFFAVFGTLLGGGARGGGANFECCVYKPQLSNPTYFAFNIYNIYIYIYNICMNRTESCVG